MINAGPEGSVVTLMPASKRQINAGLTIERSDSLRAKRSCAFALDAQAHSAAAASSRRPPVAFKQRAELPDCERSTTL